MALNFAVTDETGIRTSTNQSLGIATGPFTIAAHVVSRGSLGGTRRIFEMDSAPGTVWYLSANVMTWFGAGGVLGFDTTLVSNVAYHIAVTRDSGNTFRAFINGVQEATTHGSMTDTIADDTNRSIGANLIGTGDGFIGDMGEFAVWSVALDTNEIGVLSSGYSPENVLRQNLVSYIPMRGTNDIVDRYEGDRWIIHNNTPTLAAHPRIIYPYEGGQAHNFPVAPPAATNVAIVGMG